MRNLCVKVPKVYDWIIKEIEFHTCLSLIEYSKVTDQICSDFTLKCSSDLNSLWIANSDNIPLVGTITISFDEGCANTLDVFVNGSFVFFVRRGETKSVTVESLHSLEVRCPSGDGFCKGKYSLSTHQKLGESCLPDPVDSLKCYLADSCGNRISAFSPGAIECVEILQANGRRNRHILNSTGDTVPLQKVILHKNGCIAVEFKRNGELCKKLVPFEFTEQLLLCAPKGTRIECEISDFDCSAIIQETDTCVWIKVFINVCQSIQSKADVTITLDEVSFCMPRPDFESNCSFK